jgi:hypothetical protein
MSQEPEKPIEQQLREHAEKRRAEAGDQLELHAATRRMLQGEVARTYGTTTPPVTEHRTARPWWSWWPGVLFASCVVLLLGVMIIKPGKDNLTDFAKLSEPAPAATGAELAPTSPQPSADTMTVAAPLATESLAAGKLDMAVQNPARDAAGAPAERMEPLRQAGSAPATAPIATAERASMEKPAPEFKAKRTVATYEATPPPAASRPQPASAAAPAVNIPVPRDNALADAKVEPQTQIALKRMAAPAPPAHGAPPPAPAIAPAGAVMSESSLAASRVGGISQVTTVSNRQQMMEGSAVTFANATVADPQSRATGQQFVQTPSRADMRRNYQSPPSPEVLEQFQVQQNGTELRFIDSDGSVYVGRMVEPAADKAFAADETLRKNKDAFVLEKESAERNRVRSAASVAGDATIHYFRATGLNRSLNQPVTIDGTFMETNRSAARGGSPTGPAAKTKAEAAKQSAPPPLPLPQLQIQGRALVGDRQELIINAVPVNR